MKYWLAKSEPGTYSWADFVALGVDHWDGVRNYQARNNMKAMSAGDLVLFYHSVKDKEVVGVARVAREHYQDPTTEDERWVVVDLEPVVALEVPVSLKAIKADAALAEMALVKQSRLSVMPVEAAQFERILELGETRLPKGGKGKLGKARPAKKGAKAPAEAPAKAPAKVKRKASARGSGAKPRAKRAKP